MIVAKLIQYVTIIVRYEAPERKLQELQKNESLLRLKKGFYVFNPKRTSRLHRPEVVANLLYGPSYLSLEYALSHYGFIPERVEEVTSVTSAKNKIYRTPVGRFSYHHLSAELYPLFIQMEPIAPRSNYLIASPEKAILDFLILKTKDSEFKNPAEVKNFLEEDTRVDWSEVLNRLDVSRLETALPHYRRRRRAYWFIQQVLKEKK